MKIKKGDEGTIDEMLRKAEQEKSNQNSALADKLAARKKAQADRRAAQKAEFDAENEEMDIIQLDEQEKAYERTQEEMKEKQRLDKAAGADGDQGDSKAGGSGIDSSSRILGALGQKLSVSVHDQLAAVE